MEDWCGFSPNEPLIQQREAQIRKSLAEEEQALGKPGSMSVAMEHDKKDLKMAALSAMATLCAGPVNIMVDNKIWSDNADMHSVSSDIADLVYGGKTGEAPESSRNVAAMIASIITQEAKIAGLDRKKNGPFGKEVQRLYPHEHWEGGKLDDICTVVLIAIAK